jgi:DNA-binding MarR family transcriptional regulator
VLLDRLERAGHVRRAARTDDRRRVDVVVTDAAVELGWAFFGPVIDTTKAVLASRSPAERALIDAFLDDLVDALRGTTGTGVAGSPRGGRVHPARPSS